MMEKEFEKWYAQNEIRFHQGQFTEKQIAYSAWWASKELGEIIDCSHPKPWRKVESGFTVCNSCQNIVPRKQVESQNSLE